MRRLPLALLALCPVPAVAAGLVVSPSIVTATVEREGPLPSVNITNESGQPWECELSLAPLAQSLDGAPRAGEGAFAAVSLERTRYALAAGGTVWVPLRAAAPARGGGAYGLLEVRGRPAAGGAWSLLEAEIHLRYPGSARAEIAAGRIDVGQDKPGARAVVSVRVKNEGDVAVAVDGGVSVIDPRGKPTGQATIGPALVLPGFERMIEGTMPPPPAGTYTLQGTIVGVGAAPVSVSGALEVLRGGEVATHRAVLVGGPQLSADRTRVEIVVDNRGNLPLAAVARARIGGAQVTLAPPYPIPVGRKGTLSGVVPFMGAGEHEIELWLENPAGRPLFLVRATLR